MSESIENDTSKKTEKKIGSYHEVEGFSGEKTEKSRDGPEVLHKKPKKLKETIDQYELETDGYRRNRGENANAESDVDRESGRSVGEKGYSGGKVEDVLRMGNGVVEGDDLRHARNIQKRIRSEGESEVENFGDRLDNLEICKRPEERSQHGNMGTRVSHVTADAVALAIQKARGTISKATGEKDDSASSDVLKATEAAGGRVTRLGFDTVKKTRDFVSEEGRETSGFIIEKSISNRKKPKTESQIKKETNRKRLSRKRLSLQRKAKRAAKAGKTTAEGTKKSVSIGKFMMDTVFHGSKVFIGVIAFVIILKVSEEQVGYIVKEPEAAYEPSPSKKSSFHKKLEAKIQQVKETARLKDTQAKDNIIIKHKPAEKGAI